MTADASCNLLLFYNLVVHVIGLTRNFLFRVLLAFRASSGLWRLALLGSGRIVGSVVGGERVRSGGFLR